ncbi:hypothetical protein MRX96_058613 [Rhipicephalus microplus]
MQTDRERNKQNVRQKKLHAKEILPGHATPSDSIRKAALRQHRQAAKTSPTLHTPSRYIGALNQLEVQTELSTGRGGFPMEPLQLLSLLLSRSVTV